MKLKLPDTVCSPEDLKAIVLELRQGAQWLSQSTIKLQVTRQTAGEAPAMSPTTMLLMQAWTGGKPLDQQALNGLITELESLAATAPRMTITLAAVASRSLKKQLVAWCREKINPNTLIETRFDATLLGGMVVQFGSHIYDWSFRRQILAARERFPEVLRNV